MAQPETTEEKPTATVMVMPSDKAVFDGLCKDRTWPHWRMFRDLIEAWEHSAASRVRTRPDDIGYVTPETT